MVIETQGVMVKHKGLKKTCGIQTGGWAKGPGFKLLFLSINGEAVGLEQFRWRAQNHGSCVAGIVGPHRVVIVIMPCGLANYQAPQAELNWINLAVQHQRFKSHSCACGGLNVMCKLVTICGPNIRLGRIKYIRPSLCKERESGSLCCERPV